MLLKRKDISECNKMGNSDAHPIRPGPQGRKYLTHDERRRVLAAAAQLPERNRLFVETLAWSGARISEALALTPALCDLGSNSITLPTLKRRLPLTREIPLPPTLLADLDAEFDLRGRQQSTMIAEQRLWSMHRVTAWRLVKTVMEAAGITGRQARPHGLRHAFGVGVVRAGVPITLLKRWMGHARLSSTEVYLDVIGPEELAFAQSYWTAAG